MAEEDRKKQSVGHFENEAYMNSFLMLAPFIIGIPTAMLVPTVHQSPRGSALAAILLGLTGFILFSIAKISVFKQGHWLTWGSAQMTPRNRLFYKSGYALIIVSGFLSLAIMLVGKMLEQ